VTQGSHVPRPACLRRPGRLEKRISCQANVRVRQTASLSSWESTGWPMCTWEVSTATKRMSRVHCCRRHGLRANQQRTDRQRHTVLIGAIVEELVRSLALPSRLAVQLLRCDLLPLSSPRRHMCKRAHVTSSNRKLTECSILSDLPPGTSFNLFL